MKPFLVTVYKLFPLTTLTENLSNLACHSLSVLQSVEGNNTGEDCPSPQNTVCYPYPHFPSFAIIFFYNFGQISFSVKVYYYHQFFPQIEGHTVNYNLQKLPKNSSSLLHLYLLSLIVLIDKSPIKMTYEISVSFQKPKINKLSC